MKPLDYEHMTSLDHAFLALEGPTTCMHVAATAVLDATPLSTADGGIDTELIRNAGVDGIVSTRGVFFLSPQKAARLAVRAMKRGRYRGIPGLLAGIMVTVSRLLPARLVGRIAAQIFRPR